jgi:polyhydroxyalkanoate synthesis regulator phasin
MPKLKKVVKTSRPVKRGGKVGLVGRARAEAKSLVKDARRVGEGVQKRAEKVVRDFERRAEKLIGTIEVRAVKAMEPVLAKTFATQREMRELRSLVEALARQVEDLARRSAA